MNSGRDQQVRGAPTALRLVSRGSGRDLTVGDAAFAHVGKSQPRRLELCRWCHEQTDAPYVRGMLMVTALGGGRFSST